MASKTPCADCGESVPDGAKVCPNCGAGMVPLPVLDGDNRAAGAGTTGFRTGSRMGDIVLGILSGIFSPVLVMVLAAVPLFFMLGFLGVSQFVILPLGVGSSFFMAGRIKGKYPVLGDTMRRTLWGWLIAGGLGILVTIAYLIAVSVSNP